MTKLDRDAPNAMRKLRGQGRLKDRIFWLLVATGCSGPVLALVISGDPLMVAVSVALMVIVLVGAAVATTWLMAPLDELERRLKAKNYGAESAAQPAGPHISLNDTAVDLVSKLFQRRTKASKRRPELPLEVANLERLARAGRVSEIAMQSVTKDLFRHLSHQLKSPMAILRAHSETARHKLTTGDHGGVEESLCSIEQVTMNVAGLVEQLLSLAYVESLEERGIAAAPVNLSTALSAMIRVRKPLGLARGVQIENAVEAGLWVNGEAQLLAEMVASLVDNAVRYSPQGGEVRVEATRIPGTKTVMVRVVDQGPGIPVPERERVFEPFYGSIGADQHGTMKYGTRRHRVLPDGSVTSSHGLGLSLVRSVAKLHGADVSLDTGPGGRGLCARVLLSAVEPS
jgi:signal transduction histidine kinase